MARLHRVVRGLRWATKRASGPFDGKRRSPRGAKAQGLRYERAFGLALPQAQPGVWWEFEDSGGGGWCQTDFLLEGKNEILVIETKYTRVPQGHTQISQLYRPVVEKALGKPVLGLVVCKALRSGMPRDIKVVRDLQSAMPLLRSGREVALLWIGVGPLLRASPAAQLAPVGSPAVASFHQPEEGVAL